MNGQRRRHGSVLTMLLACVLFALAGCSNPAALTPSTYSADPDSPELVLRFQVDASDGVAASAEETDTTVVIHAELVEDDGQGGDEDVEVSVSVRLESPLGTREVVDSEGRAVPQA